MPYARSPHAMRSRDDRAPGALSATSLRTSLFTIERFRPLCTVRKQKMRMDSCYVFSSSILHQTFLTQSLLHKDEYLQISNCVTIDRKKLLL